MLNHVTMAVELLSRRTTPLKPLKIKNAEIVAEQIRDEIQSSPEGRYFHRLHLVLLVATGMTCNMVAKLFGEPLRTVQRWAKELDEEGVYALKDQDRAGRPTKLTGEQLAEVKSDIEQGPQAFNFSQGFWDGPLLSHHIEQKYGVILGVRQCQRLFRQLGYALLRPRPKPAGAKPEVRDEFKKNRMRP